MGGLEPPTHPPLVMAHLVWATQLKPRSILQEDIETSPGWPALRRAMTVDVLPKKNGAMGGRLEAAHDGAEDQTALSGPTRTTILPRLSPLKRPMKALGEFSTPSTIVSRHFILPSLAHFAMSRWKSACMSVWLETMKPLSVRLRPIAIARLRGPGMSSVAL